MSENICKIVENTVRPGTSTHPGLIDESSLPSVTTTPNPIKRQRSRHEDPDHPRPGCVS